MYIGVIVNRFFKSRHCINKWSM